MKKRLLSAFMAVVITMTSIPMNTFAVSAAEVVEDIDAEDLIIDEFDEEIVSDEFVILEEEDLGAENPDDEPLIEEWTDEDMTGEAPEVNVGGSTGAEPDVGTGGSAGAEPENGEGPESGDIVVSPSEPEQSITVTDMSDITLSVSYPVVTGLPFYSYNIRTTLTYSDGKSTSMGPNNSDKYGNEVLMQIFEGQTADGTPLEFDGDDLGMLQPGDYTIQLSCGEFVKTKKITVYAFSEYLAGLATNKSITNEADNNSKQLEVLGNDAVDVAVKATAAGTYNMILSGGGFMLELYDHSGQICDGAWISSTSTSGAVTKAFEKDEIALLRITDTTSNAHTGSVRVVDSTLPTNMSVNVDESVPCGNPYIGVSVTLSYDGKENQTVPITGFESYDVYGNKIQTTFEEGTANVPGTGVGKVSCSGASGETLELFFTINIVSRLDYYDENYFPVLNLENETSKDISVDSSQYGTLKMTAGETGDYVLTFSAQGEGYCELISVVDANEQIQPCTGGENWNQYRVSLEAGKVYLLDFYCDVNSVNVSVERAVDVIGLKLLSVPEMYYAQSGEGV